MIEAYYHRLGARVRKARLAANLSQDEVARSMDPPMTRASIANVESAKQRVLAHQIAMLARILRVPAYTLLTGAKKR